jgi:hypothetical protein
MERAFARDCRFNDLSAHRGTDQAAQEGVTTMAKAGTAYQKLVASVVKAMDPGADVKEGAWVEGPDGRRDLDVSVRGIVDGKSILVLIECKDFTSKKARVGIGYVDALDSKRKDLNADRAFICSNSGFAAPALSKAARVGIDLLTAMSHGDSRVRTVIEKEIYPRLILIGKTDLKFHFPGHHDRERMAKLPLEDAKYEGKPIMNWLREKALAVLTEHPDSSRVVIRYTFYQLLPLTFGGAEFSVTGFDACIDYKTRWHSQIVSIDADAGMYDYIRKKAVLAGNSQYMIKGFSTDTKKWKRIDFVPESPGLEFFVGAGEGSIQLTMVEGVWNEKPAGKPNVDPLIQSTNVDA